MAKPVHIGLFVGARSVEGFDLRQGVALSQSPDLASALQGLEGSRARLELVLSDAHCRYLVAERPVGIRNVGELAAAMRGRFRAVFGDVDDWALRHAATPWSRHDLVAGAQGALLSEIASRAQSLGLRVQSIRPHWVAWARHFKRGTRKGAHWIVGHDGEWATLGYLQQGQCRQVRSLRVDAASASLPDLLARERAFVDGADPDASVWLGGTPLNTEGLPPQAALTVAASTALWGANGAPA